MSDELFHTGTPAGAGTPGENPAGAAAEGAADENETAGTAENAAGTSETGAETGTAENAAGTSETGAETAENAAGADTGVETAGTAENAAGADTNAETAAASDPGSAAADSENAGDSENADLAAAASDPAAESAEGAENTEPAGPAYRRGRPRRAKTKNPGRKWGILLGAVLGSLACGCIVLLAGMAVGVGRGAAAQAGTQPSQSTPDQSASGSPDESAASLQVYDVPDDADAYTTQYIVEQVQDSVVGVLMYDGTGIDPVGAGTGIIMSADGYIITNAHVVVNTTSLTVVLSDETRYPAIVVGYDEKTDLAVLKVNATGLHPAEFGDSDQVNVGERAIAIGNPGGLTGSVSQGIISGRNREISITLSDGSTSTLTALQTDAAINPGNSGGPLLNAYGQVIGINSSKIVATGYEGIGFAIPVNEAKPILDNLIQYGYVKDRAVLGITVIALDATTGPANGLPSKGLYIASILDVSDFKNHGIDAGDVILKANGVELATVDDLSAQLKLFRPGDTITLEIYHAYDKTTMTVDIVLLDSQAVG